MKKITHGLVVKAPWSDYIVDGFKTWEIRGSKTHVRGRIAIIQSGTGCIQGYASLVDCIGPLSMEWLAAENRHHLLDGDYGDDYEMPYPKTYGWVFKDAFRLLEPIPYKHPPGAVIWVRLDN